MHRTEADNKIIVGGLNQYTDGPPGTTVVAVDKNTIQEELAYLIETNGLTLKTVATETNTQVYDAVAAQIAASVAANPQYDVDFSSKDLIIDFISTTQVSVVFKRLSLLNSSFVPAFLDNQDITFNITTDLMAGTSEKASTDYWLWLDSLGVRKMVPDLVSVTDGTTANKLVDSAADFVTDKVAVGDIVYNTTDLTQTTVTAIDDLNTLSLADDYFVSGENYKIRLLSPTGLGSYKARIGAVYNNASSNIDDSWYTQIQAKKYYTESGGHFTTSGPAGWSVIVATQDISQVNDWTGRGVWKTELNVIGNQTGSTDSTVSVTGTVFDQSFPIVVSQIDSLAFSPNIAVTTQGAGDLRATYSGSVTRLYLSGNFTLSKKPTFHH
jgi:hypothetical protein